MCICRTMYVHNSFTNSDDEEEMVTGDEVEEDAVDDVDIISRYNRNSETPLVRPPCYNGHLYYMEIYFPLPFCLSRCVVYNFWSSPSVPSPPFPTLRSAYDEPYLLCASASVSCISEALITETF